VNRSDFIRLFRLLRRRRWLVGAIALTTFTAIVIIALLMPLYYRAATVLMPSEDALTNPLGRNPAAWVEGSRMDRGERDARLKIFMDLIVSPPVLRKVRKDLKLKTSADDLKDLLLVEPAFGSAFQVTVLDRSDEGAVNLANGLADSYKQYYREATQAQADEERHLLEKMAEESRLAMADAQQDITSLRGEDIVLPDAAEGSPLLARTNDLLVQADSARAQLSDVTDRLRKTQEQLSKQPERTAVTTSTTNTPKVQALQTRLADLNRQLADARGRYTDVHPEVVRLREQINQTVSDLNQAQGELSTETVYNPNPLRASLEQQLVQLQIEEPAMRARLGSLQSQITGNEGKSKAGGAKSLKVATRTADYAAAQAAYQRSSQMLQALLISTKSLEDSDLIRVVQPAVNAEGPAPRKGPMPWQLIALGLVLSLALGAGGALVAEFFDASLKSLEDVQTTLRLPLAAVVPYIGGEERKALPQITRALPISPYAECYRYLRTNVLYSGDRQNMKSLMVASAIPSQGSSTTTSNLAIALAEAGKTVVLVDTDLRRSRQHEIFNIGNKVGLSNLLKGESKLEEALQATEIANLTILPAGPESSNPSALLNSERMREALRNLGERFDFVLVDSAPVLTFADTVVLASLLDGVLLVVRIGESGGGNELSAKLALEKAGANVLGVVVNGAAPSMVESVFYSSHYYRRTNLPALPEDSIDAQQGP
jgi:polysaccharide biosynthesis transport protein